eukprot:891665_1
MLYYLYYDICMSSAAILSLIALDHDIHTIIVAECIWKLVVETMCLYLVYLFVSKLFNILTAIVTSRVELESDESFDSSEFFDAFEESIIVQEKSKTSSYKKHKSDSG